MNSLISKKEFELIDNSDIIIQKRKVLEKIEYLFEETQREISASDFFNTFLASTKTPFQNPKISRGENYRELPYIVLDHPKHFTKEAMFSFRTLFWWGNFFSSTLHLSGDLLNRFRNQLLDNHQKFRQQALHICVNDTPWEYHYGKDNYLLIDDLTEERLISIFEKKSFIKLSRKHSLKEAHTMPRLSSDTLEFLLSMIQNQTK